MRIHRMAAMVMLLALPLAACASGSDSGSAGAAQPSLDGTAWNLAQYAPTGETTLTDVPTPVKATAAFTADQVSGSGGCNTFTGGYTVDGSTIDIGPLATTLMACIPAVTAVESAYLAQLDAATSYAVTDGTLTMSDDAGQVVLSFTEATPVSLTSTEWSAVGINNGTGGVQSLAADTSVTAVFAEDGTLSGSGGCNTYNGTYTIDGDSMTIGPLASTQMMCAEDVSAQEANYLAALANVTTYSINGDRLELRDDAGALQVDYGTMG